MDQVLGSLSFDSSVTHSRRLLGSIDWLLHTTEMSMSDIAALAIGTGPGSFTGLRIGEIRSMRWRDPGERRH